MKKRIVLLTALATLVLFAAITGCSRGDDTYYGTATFWNDNTTLSDIIVTVDGSVSDDIRTTLYPDFCNSTNHANFYLSEGYHNYSATTVRGLYLESGSFYVSGSCTYVEVKY